MTFSARPTGLAKARWSWALAMALITSASPAATGESAWQSFYDEARRQYASRQYPEAEREARRALDLAHAGKGATGPYVASSLNLLAMVRLAQGQGDEAVALLRQALGASERSLGDHPDSAALALNLANALDGLGQREPALSAYLRSLEISDRLPATSRSEPVRRQALAGLGRLYAAGDDMAQADLYNRRLLNEDMTLSPVLRAEALRRQSRVQESQGRTTDARLSLREALDLYERLSPPDTGLVLQAATELAALLGRMGLFDEAGPLHRRAVDILEQTAPKTPAMAAHLNELGLWHLQRKEYDAAQRALARARAIVDTRDPQSLEAALIVANLAQLQEAQERYDDAQSLYRQAIVIYQAHGNAPEALSGRAQALNFLASQDYRKRRFGPAESQFLEALALTERASGAQSPRLLPLLDNLVSLYRSQQKERQAVPHAERATRLRALPAQEPAIGHLGASSPNR